MNEKTIDFEGIGPVRFIRQARSKRLRIALKPTGDVVVSIPWLLSFARGIAFLEEKKEWVLKTREKLAKMGHKPLQLKSGPLFSTRNMAYRIEPMNTGKILVQVNPAEHAAVIGYPESLPIEHPEVQKKLRTALEGVLRYEAKRYLPVRIKELAQQLGYSYRVITIKNNRTNWGSCSSLHNINLNLHLMRLPDRLIDYILVHELVHTKIPNHGPGFKAQLKAHFPDMATLDREIKKFRPEIF